MKLHLLQCKINSIITSIYKLLIYITKIKLYLASASFKVMLDIKFLLHIKMLYQN